MYLDRYLYESTKVLSCKQLNFYGELLNLSKLRLRLEYLYFINSITNLLGANYNPTDLLHNRNCNRVRLHRQERID